MIVTLTYQYSGREVWSSCPSHTRLVILQQAAHALLQSTSRLDPCPLLNSPNLAIQLVMAYVYSNLESEMSLYSILLNRINSCTDLQVSYNYLAFQPRPY